MKIWLRRALIGLLVVCIAAWLGLLALQHYYAEPENYARIEDGLYMGGLVSEAPPGVSAVLNLCEMKDSYECEVHAWKPIRDAAPAPKLDWLAEQVAFIQDQRDEGRTVYVHCFQGASRSGLVVVAYLMREHGWTR
ncbi:MAG TPA: dual specificity protein phosphatase, partial [Gemmataceae bacterium]|nr:dual specificity protein phosphatase [Gemmataceae bacterium]